jgi:hypothetical protein
MANMRKTRTITISASEQYWQQVRAVARPKAKVLGITKDDVTRLANEYRKEKCTKTSKKKLK